MAVIGFDIFGGAVVNATYSAKRWYHRPGQTRRHHLGFVAVHVQPFLLALVVRDVQWSAACLVYVLALMAAIVITLTPESLRTPIAFAATVFGVALTTTLLPFPQFLGWFAPVLLIKLLLAHLLPEPGCSAPLQPTS